MNRAWIHALVMLGAVFCLLFVFDRPDFTRFVSSLGGFAADHWLAVVLSLIAIAATRLLMRSPHQTRL